MMGKSNRSASASRTPKDPVTQLSRNIPEIFRTLRSGDHEASQTPQASGPTSPSHSSDYQLEDGDTRSHRFSPAVNLSDLQKVASDITHNITGTLKAAILDLKMDIQAVAARISDVEQTTQLHTAAIRQVQHTYDAQLSYLYDLHRQVEDLDNRGRRHNVRVRGVPEGMEAGSLPQVICAIFNDLLDRLPDSPIEMERLHRALRPPPRDNEPPRDVICCIVNFPLKEEILRKARERGRVQHNGVEIKLFQDLSPTTLQNKRALRPLLDHLRARNIPYRWKFPFCLSATARGRTALLRSPDDLPAFCEQLDLPMTELPEWCSFHFPSEPWRPLSHNPSPKAQRHRSRRRRSGPPSPGAHTSRRDMDLQALGQPVTPRRPHQDA